MPAFHDNSLQLSPISNIEQPTHDHNMDPMNFTNLFSNALNDENVRQGLRNAMKPLTEAIEKKLDSSIQRIDNIEITLDETTSKIDKIDQKMEELEQYSRKNNVRIIGLPELTPTNSKSNANDTENIPAKVVKLIKEAMNIDICLYDIGNAHRLGRTETRHDRDTPRPRDIIVQFTSNIIKQQVMRNRKYLRDTHKHTYINDDLTQANALLFKDARNEVRNQRLHAAWTRDGHIFAKIHENSKPTKIRNARGLSELIRL